MTTDTITSDICIIGGGSGGLSLTAGAVQMGARVVLIERGRMGGDCLNTGCVPSKAMLEAAKIAKTARAGHPAMGISVAAPEIDFAAVKAHIQDVIAGIAPHDSEERFSALGVTVIKAEAKFSKPDEVIASTAAGDIRVHARYFVIATGSYPVAPPVPGLADTPFLTNETIFDLQTRPDHLMIIGGGPIGMEMAQAHRRLGCDVTVIEAFSVMGRDDPELARRLVKQLEDEGIRLIEQARIAQISQQDEMIMIHFADGSSLGGSHLLVAAGRKPNIEALNLAAAKVEFDAKGIITDRRLRSSNKRIYAVGDVAGRHQFTHVASYHASIVIRNILFKLPAYVRDNAIPYVTYTDPELAQVGLSWPEAIKKYGAAKLRCTDWHLTENDRARAARRTEGMVRIVSDRRGRILGASILAPHAGEMIHSWTLAISSGLKLSSMAAAIAPYPSWSEASKRAAGAFFSDRLFSKPVQALVRFLVRL